MLGTIAESLGGSRKASNGFTCRCPCHDDTNASLSLSEKDGMILWHCFAGCSQSDITAELRRRGLIGNGKDGPASISDRPAGIRAKYYDRVYRKAWAYHDVGGRVIGYKARFEHPVNASDKKIIPYFRRDGAGWKEGEVEGKQLLYDVHRVLPATAPILVCEGEGCCEALKSLGAVATTSGSATSARKADWTALDGKTAVVLWPDNDDAGARYMGDVIRELRALPHPPKIRVVDVAKLGLSEKQDCVDWHRAHPAGRLDDLPLVDAPPGAEKSPQSGGGAGDSKNSDKENLAGPGPEIKADLCVVESLEEHRAARKSIADVRALTDLGNAERLVDSHGQILSYTHESGWRVWDRRRWAPDPGGLSVAKLAQRVAREIRTEAEAMHDRNDFAIVARHAVRSEGAARINAVIDLARPMVVRQIGDFDKDPMLLNCNNGTVDLRTGELRPHSRDDLITRCTDIDFNPDATAPRWIRFLEEVQSDPYVRVYLQKAIGYSVTGLSKEEVFFLLYGAGRNGKSKFLGGIHDAIGGYATAAPPGLLLAKKQQDASNDIAGLNGQRFVSSVETGEGKRFDEERIKGLTGGDRISARFLYHENFTFQPICKLWLASNYRPIVRGQDLGFWRRCRLIPFEARIPDEAIDLNLAETLKAEAPGILTWIVRGCQLWIADGLKSPPRIAAATNDYKTDSDTVGKWENESLRSDPICEVSAYHMLASFKRWATANNERELSQQVLGRKLSERGYSNVRRGGKIYWQAVRLEGEPVEKIPVDKQGDLP